MRLSDLAKGSTVLLGVIVAGYLSTTYVDQRFATQLSAASPPAQTSPSAPTNGLAPPTGPAPSACVDADGSWKHWSWPNVPALSPKCK